MSERALLLIHILGFLLIPANEAFPQCWVYKYSGTSNPFNAISFSDANHGFIVGEYGAAQYTTDGGITWLNPTIKVGSPFYGVSCYDPNTITLVGYDLGRSMGMIYHTTNGGDSWIRQNSGTTQSLLGVSFATQNLGLAVGVEGTIQRTTDGGSTWLQQESGTTTYLSGVTFLNAQTAVAVGYVSNRILGAILRTIDAGITWSIDTMPPRPFFAVSFSGPYVGYAVGQYGAIYKSTNSGITWSDISINQDYVLNGVSFIDAQRGTIVGYDASDGSGVIVTTSNGGTVWQITKIPHSYFSGVFVHDATAGTVISTSGDILHQFDNCSQAGWLTAELPVNGALREPLITTTDRPRSITLQWNLLADINVAGTLVQLAVDSTFSSSLAVNTLIPLNGSLITRRITAQDLEPGTRYFWRMRINYKDGSWTAWSDVSEFTTARGSISGQIFEDVNHDSTWNPSERILAGWKVNLTGKITGSVLTDSAGRFTFAGLDSGLYALQQALPVVWIQTVPASTAYNITLADGDSVRGLVYGNYFPWNSVSGSVFNDVNENGIQDNGEQGLSGWLVRVEEDATDSVVTDENGNFVFPRLVLGTLTFHPVVPQPWEQISPQLGEGRTIIINNYDQHYSGLAFGIHRIPARVKVSLLVKDSTSFAHREIWFGIRPGATKGIWGADSLATNADFSEGEFDLPPQTFGLFDVRFVKPLSSNGQYGYGSWTDMRPYISSAQVDTYRVTFTPGYFYGGDYPMTLRWSIIALDTSFDSSVVMKDAQGSVTNMKQVDSLVIFDTSVNSVMIIASHPRMPIVDVKENATEQPDRFALSQNYPNPFNPMTVIRYQLPVESRVELKLYDVLGREVTTLVDEIQASGYRSVEVNGSRLSSGVYFYRMDAASVDNPGNVFVNVKKLLLLK